MAKKKNNQKDTPKVNPELEGFEIKIDPFGEIKTNFNIDKINEFLNKNVDDKKLRDRDDISSEAEQVQDESLFDEGQPVKDQFEGRLVDDRDEEEQEEDISVDDIFKIGNDYDDFEEEEDDEDDIQ